ncbi:MAG: redoxin domain-containing protein [Planctomycetota bacterium]
MNRFALHLLAAALLAGSAVSLPAWDARAPVPDGPTVSAIDLAGEVHDLRQNPSGSVRALVFLSIECPIANGSLPTLNRLHAVLAGANVELLGVVSERDVSRRAAAAHFAEYGVTFPVLFDASGALADALGPTHVPEAFVFDPDGVLVYRGAIDDAWLDLGRRRPEVQHRYLGDAIDAARAGRAPAVPRTDPVGCLVESAPEDGAAAAITYTRDIAPILQARCVSCHREGQVAPFALETYAQAAKRARQIVRVTSRRIMPPWMPRPGHDRFVGERWLTYGELHLLARWSETGRAEGDADDLPPAPEFADGWRMGEPDLVLEMTEAFTVPADGPDLFQYFVIPVDVPDDRLVAAIEFLPGNERVVHHSVLFLDASGEARRRDAATPEPGYAGFGGPGFTPSGALGGWSVGNTPRRLPGGKGREMGRYLAKGSDLVMQIHYHPTGKVEVDRSKVGLYFVDEPVAEVLAQPARLVGSIWAANYEMDIPAGAADYRRSASYTLPRDVILVGVVPHMHLLGRSISVTATPPDGAARGLIDIEAWNYGWQDEYYYERPIPLPAGTRLTVDAVFDNSDDNPSNPSIPPERVTWGDETDDEMLFCFFLLTANRTEDLIHVVHDNVLHDLRQPRADVGR